MFALSLLLLGIWVLGILLTFWGTWLCHKLFRTTLETEKEYLPISIIKPIKGIDSDLSKNLESFFQLDYPHFEIIFCIASPEDPAISLVTNLMDKHPAVDAHLYVGEENIGLNPKINTISRAYDFVKYDAILISDSNVRVTSEYLKEISQTLDEDTGIVTAIVAGTKPHAMGGVLEATYLNTFYARWMNLAAWFGCPTVVGKCMFFRKTVLERVGGLKTFGCYIAEDYVAGQAMGKLGLKVKMMRIPVRQHIGAYSFKSYWQRHIRWGRIRKTQAPFAFVAEPIFFSLVSGIFGAVSLDTLFGISPVKTLCAHFLGWALLDLFLISKLDGIHWRVFIGWIVRELLAVPLWAHAMVGNTVLWRGTRYSIAWGGIVKEKQDD